MIDGVNQSAALFYRYINTGSLSTIRSPHYRDPENTM